MFESSGISYCNALSSNATPHQSPTPPKKMSSTIPENAPLNPTPDDGPGQPEKEKEVEGIRAAQLRKIFTIALERSIKNCSYENFSKCFPTPARRAPGMLRGAWQQMCEFWEGLAKVCMTLCINQCWRVIVDVCIEL